MAGPTDLPPPGDPGLTSFALMLRLLGVASTPEQIAHQLDLGRRPMTPTDMLRGAKRLGLKARLVTTRPERLARTPLPAIAWTRDGRAFVLAKLADGQALIQDPAEPRPTTVRLEQLAARWDGRLVLMARRAGLVDLARRFDVSWFIGALHKYRWLLGEVLAASFF